MIQEIKDTILELTKLDILKGVFSMPRNKSKDIKKCVIRQLSDNNFQFERFTNKQAFHENVSFDALCDKICTVLENEFYQLQIFTPEYIYSLKLTSKGKLLQNRCKNTQKISTNNVVSHNKEKNYIITSENIPPVFHDLGITDNNGKIINSMYDKYRQICRFVELINDVVSKDKREEYTIVDFGCGKSYLTFIVYHYMTVIMNKRVKITGLDLKSDVMQKCKSLANKYNYVGMEFLCMDIKDYKPKARPDMVIALHACDIATDYALYNAYLWQTDYIFSVPCCQHELNSHIKTDNFSLLCDYGIIKERFSALSTDAMRAKLLEYCGYKVDVVEFINEEFSPKNILLRASRTTNTTFLRRTAIYNKIEAFKKEFCISQTLDKLVSKKSFFDGEYRYIMGKASMLLKDVMYLRKKLEATPIREESDETDEFVCVYNQDGIVYCAKLLNGKLEGELISDNILKSDLKYLNKFTV